jgi:hypothetical protein
MHLPLLGGDGLDQMLFGGALRLPIVEEAGAMAVVSLLVLLGGDDYLAGEAMAGSVQAGTLLAGGRDRSGRVLRVLSIGIELGIRYKSC